MNNQELAQPIFKFAVGEPEKQQNDDKRDIAMCRGIPELRIAPEGIWKTDKTGGNAKNTVHELSRTPQYELSRVLSQIKTSKQTTLLTTIASRVASHNCRVDLNVLSGCPSVSNAGR